jgi:hypothetical protein
MRKKKEYGVICQDQDQQQQSVFAVRAISPQEAIQLFVMCQEDHWTEEEGGTPHENCPCCTENEVVPDPGWEPVVAVHYTVLKKLYQDKQIAFMDSCQ